MQRPPVSDTSPLERKMSADRTSSGEGRSSRGSTERGYEVLLSFRGSDTREGIADHLYTRLVGAGSTAPIFPFRAAEDLPTGGRFGSLLLDAIAWSKISIPVLSESYATGKWCLREVVRMVENRETVGLVVMPIFDEAEHPHAQRPMGSFWEAFHPREMCSEQRDVEAGRRALRDVSFSRGWESEEIGNGHQREFVRIGVETVLSELRQGFRIDVPETLVGIDDQMKKIIELLDTTHSSARTIGYLRHWWHWQDYFRLRRICALQLPSRYSRNDRSFFSIT